MYVFTNTITTLYDYYLKLVIYSDNGLTGTTTATNGGYILSIGEITEEIDAFTGEYKPGGLSLEFLNVGNVISDGVFGGTIAEMEARLWISYDAGTSWENLFYGTVKWEGLRRTDLDETETTNRRYAVSCEHSLLSLKEIEIDTDPTDGGNVPTPDATPSTTVESFATDVNGNPISGFSYNDYEFISLDAVLQYIVSNVQFIAGATAPTISYDSSAMQHVGRSLAGLGVDYDFSELYILFNAPSVDEIEGFFEYSSGKYGAYALKNLQEMLKLFMDSLLMIPITRMTESGGAFTLEVYFEPRFRNAADLDAVVGTVDIVTTREMSVQEWLDGYQVITTGLPEKSYSTINYSGRTFELKNHLMTGPYFGKAIYAFVYTHIVPAATTGLDTIRHDGPSAQMLYGILGGTVNTINQFKHLASQNIDDFSDPSTGGYYSVHHSAFDIASKNLDPRSRSYIYGQKGYDITAKTLAANDSGTKSIWELRLLKKITIDSTTCQIVSIRRNVMRNEISIRAIEVL